MNTDNFEEIFKLGISGIKKFIEVTRILPFDEQSGVISGTEQSRDYLPGQGIVEKTRKTLVIFHCGHPESCGFGVKLPCGHVICKMCMQNSPLECAEPGCFRRFCPVAGCKNKPHMFTGLPFCLKHKISLMLEMSSLALVFGREKVNRIIDGMREQYSLRQSRMTGEELTNGRKSFPGKSS